MRADGFHTTVVRALNGGGFAKSVDIHVWIRRELDRKREFASGRLLVAFVMYL